jgi:hypothetical protein
MKARSAIAPKRKRFIGRILGVAASAGGLAWLVMAGASAGTPSQSGAASVADETPGYAVEDYAYPQADKILAEQGITLKRGDGHIVLVDCASGTGFLELSARDKPKICFRVTGNSGFLTLEIPAVNGIKGNDYSTQVDMTVEDEKKTYDVNKNSWTAVGETADPEGRDHVLVEIRTTK